MKKNAFFILLSLVSMIGFSQEDLFNNDWILHYMVIDGETTNIFTAPFPSIVFNNSSNEFDVFATVNGFNYFAESAPPTIFNQDSFIVQEGIVTLGDCTPDCELESKYLDNILFGFEREFGYEIINESDGNKILIITTPEGNIAVHGNYFLSIDEFTKRNTEIYPNPAENVLHINSKELTIEKINIFSMLGTNVMETNDIHQNYSIDVSSLKTGVYFVQVIFENGNDYIHKFIKK